MIGGSLPLAPSDDSLALTKQTMTKEREDVVSIVKVEIERLLSWGAETCGMTFVDYTANSRRPCLRPKNMRKSYLQDDSLANLKIIHWIFHELPETCHQRVLMRQMSHMNLVTEEVMRQLNVVWGEKREGEEVKRTTCSEKIYARTTNE